MMFFLFHVDLIVHTTDSFRNVYVHICKDTSVSLYVFEHFRIYSYLHTAILYIYISHSKPLGNVVAVDAFSVQLSQVPSLHPFTNPSPNCPRKEIKLVVARRNQAACMYKKDLKTKDFCFIVI